ncbi:MAG: protein-glutamate O-methyltransferase CheR [Clostridiales bacterium]
MDYTEFKISINKMIDLNLSDYKEKQMKRRIDALINKNGFKNYQEYIVVLKKDRKLLEEFVNYLTINVSEFYRNPEQWEMLENEILPELLKNTKRLKIWSSACSTGDEPYTLAMVLSNLIGLDQISIYATDIDDTAIDKAKKGVYDKKSLENLPNKLRNKYFIQSNNKFVIKDSIKNCVKFGKINLLKDIYPTNLDLIVCRNVVIYFTDDAKNRIYSNFSDSLKKDGILFVGSTEQIIMSKNFLLKPIRTFFYTKELALV